MFRPWLVVAMAILCLPGAAAQTTTNTTDGEGDARVGGAVPADYLDIVAASATLLGTNLSIAIEVLGGDQAHAVAPVTYLGAHEYWIAFRYRGELFHAVIFPTFGNVPDTPATNVHGDTTVASLYRQLASANPPWEHIATGDGRYDAATSSFLAEFLLSDIKATNGFQPGPGESLFIESASSYADEGPSSIHDIPRGGIIPGPFAATTDDAPFPVLAQLMIPGEITGGIALSTPQPIRYSNGEATTVHWPVSIVNRGTAPFDATLEVTGDAQTSIRVPDAVRVPTGESRTVDVFATIPFSHIHGGERNFNLIVRGGGQEARMDLTVKYLDVPQPAGHHSTIYLHKSGTGLQGTAWLDTLAEPDRPVDEKMLFSTGFCRPAGSLRDAQAPVGFFALDPKLQIGLAAKPGLPATLKGVLDFPIPHPASHLMARLIVYDPLNSFAGLDSGLGRDENTTSIAIDTTLQPRQLPFEFEVPVPPELQYFPPGSGKNLGLAVGLCPDVSVPSFPDPTALLVVANQGPTILHGATLDMPLNEFHDPIPISAVNGPRFSVNETNLRIIPGGQALWLITVTGNATRYVAEVFGASAQDAVLHSPTVRPGQTIPVSLSVPADAKQGDYFEIILSVQAADDAQAASAIRLTATADREGRDDAAAVSQLTPDTKDSPGTHLAIVIMAIAFLAAVRRRS